MKKWTCLSLLSLLLMGASAAFGADALYWADNTVGIDRMEEALNEDSLALDVTIASDAANFNALVASQDWDLIVLAFQDGGGYDVPNFVDYVINGGKAIFCDYNYYTESLYALFGATTTDNEGETVITVLSNDLTAGLDSNPFTITDEYWGIFSYGMSPLASGDIVMATFDNGDAAVIASNGGKTIINGFLNDTTSDDVLFVNEIRYLLPNLSPDSKSAGQDGCNMMALAPAGLLLLAPLALLLKKSR